MIPHRYDLIIMILSLYGSTIFVRHVKVFTLTESRDQLKKSLQMDPEMVAAAPAPSEGDEATCFNDHVRN